MIVLKGNNNSCARCIVCYLECCLDCITRCIKFINKNAYIQIALTNHWFCTAAWNGYALVITNAYKFGAVNTIGTVYNIFGVIAVCSSTGLLIKLIMNTHIWEVSTPIPIIVMCVLISFIVAQMSMSCITYAADAVLQSFLMARGL